VDIVLFSSKMHPPFMPKNKPKPLWHYSTECTYLSLSLNLGSSIGSNDRMIDPHPPPSFHRSVLIIFRHLAASQTVVLFIPSPTHTHTRSQRPYHVFVSTCRLVSALLFWSHHFVCDMTLIPTHALLCCSGKTREVPSSCPSLLFFFVLLLFLLPPPPPRPPPPSYPHTTNCCHTTVFVSYILPFVICFAVILSSFYDHLFTTFHHLLSLDLRT
jgi:hypothetical protein